MRRTGIDHEGNLNEVRPDMRADEIALTKAFRRLTRNPRLILSSGHRPTLVATRFNPDLKAKYQQFIAARKCGNLPLDHNGYSE